MRDSVKTRNSLLPLLVLSLFLAFLSGCGFHLKGLHNTEATSKSVYVTYENVTADFRQAFQQILREDAQQVMDAKSADVKLVFLKETCQRRSLTVTDRGIPAEYRLSCTVNYRINESSMIRHREVSESRDFKSNNAQLLALESQQDQIKQQIRLRLSQLIIRRLSSLH